MAALLGWQDDIACCVITFQCKHKPSGLGYVRLGVFSDFYLEHIKHLSMTVRLQQHLLITFLHYSVDKKIKGLKVALSGLPW